MRISDWSSDVCASDLEGVERLLVCRLVLQVGLPQHVDLVVDRLVVLNELRLLERGVNEAPDRKSVVSGKRVSVRVDLGGRRIIKKNKNTIINQSRLTQYNTILINNN